MARDDGLLIRARTSVEVGRRRQGGENALERTRHAPYVGPGPVHATARRTPSHRAGDPTRRRRHEAGRFAGGHIVEPRVAHETSPEQIVRCRQSELADDFRELVERCIARDLNRPAWTELANQAAIARQEHATLVVCKRHERRVVR